MKLYKLFEPQSYKDAPPAEIRLICNGCGAANAKFDFVPDRIYRLKIGAACEIHDWMYHKGVTIQDKQEADRVFLNNLLRIIEAESNRFMKPLRRRRALKYYSAVVDFGGPAYWSNK